MENSCPLWPEVGDGIWSLVSLCLQDFFFAVVTATLGSDLWVQEDVRLNWKFESEKELL